MADMGAIAALLSIPVALATAWWNKRSAERASDAALAAGRAQAAGSLTAVRVQDRTEHDRWHRAQLGDATAEFLRAVDALVRTVKRLPDVEHQQRQHLVREHAMAVEDAYAPLELITPTDLLSPVKQLRTSCRHLELAELDRAVLRSAINALQTGWRPGCAETGRCAGDGENCTHEGHNAAWVAWDLLTGWTGKDHEERRNDRGLLDFCLRESGTLSDTQVDQTLELADRCPSTWNRLIGGWIRDPLMDSTESAREAFVTAARTRSGPFADHRATERRFWPQKRRSTCTERLYHQQTKNLLTVKKITSTSSICRSRPAVVGEQQPSREVLRRRCRECCCPVRRTTNRLAGGGWPQRTGSGCRPDP